MNKKGLGLLVLIGLVFVLALNFLPADSKKVEAAVTTNLNGDVVGWMWSSNIGWLKLDSNPTQPVKVESNQLKGYAWSPNVGWVRFNPAETVFPSNPQHGVQIVGGTVTGWARACSVYASGCSGSVKNVSGTELGGWDGWVKIEDRNNSGMAKYDAATQTFSGFAWGSLNLGWLRFWPLDSTPDPSCSDPDVSKRPADCPVVCIGCNPGVCTQGVNCPENCTDGIDNDGNGLIDNSDPACIQCTVDGQPVPPSPGFCCNGDSDDNGTCGTQIIGTCTLNVTSALIKLNFSSAGKNPDNTYNSTSQGEITISNCGGDDSSISLTPATDLPTGSELACGLKSGDTCQALGPCSGLSNTTYCLGIKAPSSAPRGTFRSSVQVTGGNSKPIMLQLFGTAGT